MTNNWLTRALEESRARGFLGPNAIEPHITHAEGFALCWETSNDAPPEAFLDLGSGGGLPGLVLLQRWQQRAVFTDSMEKRMAFLREVLEWDGAPEGGEVLTARAEDLAWEPDLDSTFNLVTARSFGPPAVTAECGVRFLKVGGMMVISEPPDDSETGRWNKEGLAKLGLEAKGRVRHGSAYQVLIKTKETAASYPREVGVPGKKPLF